MSKIIEEKKDYKYDAFISYRHNDLDKFVAENLHKMLETYVLPKNVREELNLDRKGIKRVFRDQEELPLSSNLEDPIVDALENSKYLIIICSPRLKDSMWCKKEIQTFKKLRGRKNMFCVLVEGEPSDSFPEEVLFEEKTVIDEKGKKHTEKINIEPLAADVRGENKKEIYNKLKSEKLRLIAPMFNIDYDKLRQRHHERKVKRVITISILVAIFCILFTLYSSYMLIKISNQRKMLAENQAVNLAKEASKYYEKDNIEKSIKNAYSALTTYKGVKMPYTSKAAYELTLASGIYDAGNSYKVNKNYITKGIVDNIKISNNKKYLVSYDESETLTIWNIKNDKKIKELGNIDGVGFNENSYSIINDKMLAYINKDSRYGYLDCMDIREIAKELKE